MANPQPLNTTELDHLYRLSRSRSRYDELFVRTLANTGMRVNEFAHMEDSWFNPGETWIRIPRSRPCGCGECNGEWTPKTGAGDRVIPIIDQRTFSLLVAYFRDHDEIDRSRWTVYRHIRDMGEEVGIDRDMYPHRLRDTYATRLANWGVDVYTLKAVMGWDSLETAQHYIEVAPGRVRDEIEKVWGGAPVSEVSQQIGVQQA